MIPVKTTLSDYLRSFVDLIYPRLCEGCEGTLVGNEQVVCTQCQIRLPRIVTGSSTELSLTEKFVGYSQVSNVQSFLIFTKKGVVQRLLHALKYGNRPEIGVFLGRMMAREYKEKYLFPDADLIVSVPLHRRKKRQRGYNQSDSFAKGLSEVSQVPVQEVLSRTKHTKSQTGKTKEQRRRNVEGIFEVKYPLLVRDRRVILVDDVLTTGATLESCVDALVRSGCQHIYIMTIATAQR